MKNKIFKQLKKAKVDCLRGKFSDDSCNWIEAHPKEKISVFLVFDKKGKKLINIETFKNKL